MVWDAGVSNGGIPFERVSGVAAGSRHGGAGASRHGRAPEAPRRSRMETARKRSVRAGARGRLTVRQAHVRSRAPRPTGCRRARHTAIPVLFGLIVAGWDHPLAAQDADCQAPGFSMRDLASLVGTWRSELDPKYHDHPMVRRFNPELAAHEMKIDWGPEQDYLRITLREEGPEAPHMEGFGLPDAELGNAFMVEYNVEQDLLFRGHHGVLDNGDIERIYRVVYRDGSTARYRELWHWRDMDRSSFDWITFQDVDGNWVEGEIIVRWVRQKG